MFGIVGGNRNIIFEVFEFFVSMEYDNEISSNKDDLFFDFIE